MPAFDAQEMAAWCEGTWDSSAPSLRVLQGVSNDTRTLPAGALYVALKGERFDGHAFVADAFRKGAAGAMVAADWTGLAGGPLLRVSNTSEGLRKAARAYRRKVGLKVVAVTGSAGKSTVKEMIAAILTPMVPTAATRGNWNNDIGLPLSLLQMDASARAGVFEIGMNHPGELQVLCRILEPDHGVITNVGPVHVEYFGDVEAIAAEKATVFRSLPAGGVSFLDGDGPFQAALRKQAPGRVVAVSMFDAAADYHCTERDIEGGAFVVRERESGETAECRLPIGGDHNVVNAMFAMAVGRLFGAGWNSIVSALAGFHPLPMRWQRETLGGVEIINDAYNANPLSMRAALRTLREHPAAGRRWVVLGGMLELGDRAESEHVALGKLAGELGFHVVAVGSHGEWIAHGAAQAGLGRDRLFLCGDPREAAGRLASNVKPGDVVLLKASRGIRMEQAIDALRKGGMAA